MQFYRETEMTILIIWIALGLVAAVCFGHIAKEMSDEI